MMTSKNSHNSESNATFDERKGIRINDFQELGWDPDYIRNKLDQMSNERFDFLKEKLSNKNNHTIRISGEQAAKWDPDIIRYFLNVKQDVCRDVKQQKNKNEFKKGFKILANVFGKAMKDNSMRKRIAGYLSKNGKPSEDYETVINLIEKLEDDAHDE